MNRAFLQTASFSNQPCTPFQSHNSLSERTEPSVSSSANSSSGAASACLPGKAISQRRCVTVVQYDHESDSNSVALNQQPTIDQQEPEPQADDDGGQWQVVSRRRSGNKQQKSFDAVPAGHSDAQVTVRAKKPSANQLTRNRSAGNQVTGQNQRLHKCRQDTVSLCSSTLGSYWPLCIKSFARLAELDMASFGTCLKNYLQLWQTDITKDDFLRFHHLMTKGPQAIRRVEDIAFLAGPFKVLMFRTALSSDVAFLSLLLEFKVPGFLTMLSDRFVLALAATNGFPEELRTAITELLTDMSQKDNRWLDRLGWQELSRRHQCELYSYASFLLKKPDKNAVILSLQRQVSRQFLETFFYAALDRLQSKASNPHGVLRDLRAVVRATALWLRNQYIVTAQSETERNQCLLFATVCEALFDALGSLELCADELLCSLWQIVAKCLFNLRFNLSKHLGFDRTIALLDGLLQRIHRWPELVEKFANDYRLRLLEVILMKCEEQSLKRDVVMSFQLWKQYKSKLESLLLKCDQFMGDSQSPFVVSDSVPAERKEEVRLNLMLRKSAFSRLDCFFGKLSWQQIQDNLHKYQNAFTTGWALSEHHWEIGTLELAKWYFLAGEHDAGVRCLMGAGFNSGNLRYTRAQLLAKHGAHQIAIDEYRHIKAQTTDQSLRDQIDSRIAMAQLHLYQAEKNIDHLISAYRLSVALLGRCNVCDRGRFQGGLSHIVNAMKTSGLKFKDFAGETAVLGYLVKDGCGIKNWNHFAVLLHVRHKLGLTDAHMLTDGLAGTHLSPD